MTSAELQALVTRSTLLSPADRAYWLESLPTMSPEETAKLEGILTQGEKINIGGAVKNYFSVVAQSKPQAA